MFLPTFFFFFLVRVRFHIKILKVKRCWKKSSNVQSCFVFLGNLKIHNHLNRIHIELVLFPYYTTDIIRNSSIQLRPNENLMNTTFPGLFFWTELVHKHIILLCFNARKIKPQFTWSPLKIWCHRLQTLRAVFIGWYSWRGIQY